MKLATWNVNSLKVRLPQVLEWLENNRVSALCLQELKLPDDKFPLDAFREIGYQAQWAGQKTYNGVAVLAPAECLDVQSNITGFEDNQQDRKSIGDGTGVEERLGPSGGRRLKKKTNIKQ